MTYTYNLGGAMVEQQYPSGRVVKNSLDATGDLSMVASKENSSAIFKTYVNDFTYNAAGAVTSLKLGNGRFESTQFNSRLQPTQIALCASVGDASSLKLDYEYGSTTAVNNGNVTKQTITVPGMTYPLIQNYTYDSLNRLDDANETSNGTQTWRQDFSYDRYGNRNFVESNTSFAGFDKLCNSNTELCTTLRKQLNPGINSGNNNRMNSGQDYTYDSAGNTLTDANGQIFVYDGENKQVKASTSSGTVGEYFYDGDGKRVKKYVPGTGETTIFVYDAGGQQIAEYSTIVADASTAKVAYLTADHLGSPRINTDVTGAITSRHDYHPFGEEIATTQRTSGLGYPDDTVRKQFTGYEHDGETDLDFAQARYYSNNFGRFAATDPIILNSIRMNNPQGFNAYSYTANNPLRFTDPFGEDLIAADETQRRNVKKLAPGSKIDANGNVKKPNFFHRVLNRLTGHGGGSALVSSLVDSKKVTTAFSGGVSVTVDLDTDEQIGFMPSPGDQVKAMAARNGVSIDPRTNILISVGSESPPERTSTGSIEKTSRGSAILLGHELIHASHILDGSYDPNPRTKPPMGEHDFSENGVNYVERNKQEEFRAVGLRYNKTGDITENQLRKELGINRPRATYNARENWELRK